MYDVLEEGQRNVLSLWPSNFLTPSRVEGKNQIHVRFTVIFFPSGILSCIGMRLEEG